MQAWQLQDSFGLQQLRSVEVPSQPLGPGQLRLAVQAVSLNFRDLLMVQGLYNPKQPLPLVPCSDAACRVVAVGDGVTGWSAGDRVMPIFTQGWLAGTPRAADMATTLGGPLPGTLQAEMVVPSEAVVRVPAHLTDAQAATLPCAAVTAWRALFTDAGIGPGSRVLTLGTGGVSLFALQLAKAAGAQVAITSSSEAKLAKAAAMGADVCVNYRTDADWGRTVRRWAQAQGADGVDVVVELGGAGTLDQSIAATRPLGHIALIGVLAGVQTKLALTKILMRGLRVQGVLVGSRADAQALVNGLAANPGIKPVVDRVFDWSAVPDAFAHLASQAHMGKVVVAGPGQA